MENIISTSLIIKLKEKNITISKIKYDQEFTKLYSFCQAISSAFDNEVKDYILRVSDQI